MNSLLPNMRLLGLESSIEGRDFEELSREIDSSLESLGYDLAEEAVYLFYSGPDECFVARSVIGPLKDSSPLILRDWSAAPVQRQTLAATTWSELEALIRDFQREKTCIRLVRELKNGQLFLKCEGIIHD